MVARCVNFRKMRYWRSKLSTKTNCLDLHKSHIFMLFTVAILRYITNVVCKTLYLQIWDIVQWMALILHSFENTFLSMSKRSEKSYLNLFWSFGHLLFPKRNWLRRGIASVLFVCVCMFVFISVYMYVCPFQTCEQDLIKKTLGFMFI